MAVCLINKSGGGITSDDVTAKRWHVVQGFTALTSDSGDEPANGELANKGNGGASNGVVCPEMFYYTSEGAYVARFDAGAYYNTGERGQWKPYVSVPVWMAKQATNYHPEKTLSDTVTCQERGTVKMIDTKLNNYTNNQARNIGIDSGRGKLWMELGHGNAYYYRDDNVPHVETDASKFGTAAADSVLQWQTATSQHGIKFEGTIPRWIATHGDVIIANSSHSGQGFAYDLPNVGRCIVVGIKNGAFIQGANYVALPSPNFLPHNIRKGVNINGIIGTMPDYSTGRTVFNGATFDETLLSGVANKDFHIGRDYYPLKLADGYGYTGIYGGGINLALSTSMLSIRGRQIGCVMSQSVNLAPFNRIAIYWRFDGTIKNRAYFDFKAFVALASNVQRGIFHYGSSPIDGFSTYRKEIFMFDQTQVSYIDVGDINEHAFLGFHAKADVDNRDKDSLSGSLQVTRIDFLN